MRVDAKTLLEQIANCTSCSLHKTRTCTVAGEGGIGSGVMFVGEGPGREEDRTGRPFVGAAGQLLDKMLASIQLSREIAYIANVVKCRPPDNRVPLPEEVKACLPYLRAQVALLKPRIIVALGSTAAKAIINPDIRITRDRGQWYEKKGVAFIATYHPAALLRDPDKKREAWADMQSIRDKIQS